jgi:hypothetical protein
MLEELPLSLFLDRLVSGSSNSISRSMSGSDRGIVLLTELSALEFEEVLSLLDSLLLPGKVSGWVNMVDGLSARRSRKPSSTAKPLLPKFPCEGSTSIHVNVDVL